MQAAHRVDQGLVARAQRVQLDIGVGRLKRGEDLLLARGAGQRLEVGLATGLAQAHHGNRFVGRPARAQRPGQGAHNDLADGVLVVAGGKAQELQVPRIEHRLFVQQVRNGPDPAGLNLGLGVHGGHHAHAAAPAKDHRHTLAWHQRRGRKIIKFPV